MWLTNLITNGGVASTVLMLATSIFAGLLLGKIKVRGITLGITWVLFVGILISALGIQCNYDMLQILKELGLILFVTAVGLQVGPGFFQAFKRGGLMLNVAAIVNVLLGVGITILVSKFADENLTDMAGVYTGAVTNTPGLSAAQQAVREAGVEGAAARLASGYAVAYPLAVVGMILCCIILKPKQIKASEEKLEEPIEKEVKVEERSVKRGGIKLIPIFIVIAIGIIIGSIPIPVGMSAPVKLGAAGGPLVVALLAGWLGVKRGWFTKEYTESQGIMMLREVGIAIFLAGVGLCAGGSFIDTLKDGGYMWILYGIMITMLPPLIVGLLCRFVLKTDHYTLMGVIGGMHTDPPTLAFANSVAPEGSKLPNIGYATVYPLTMFLRILTAQLLVLMAL